jgi:hypothetical protein
MYFVCGVRGMANARKTIHFYALYLIMVYIHGSDLHGLQAMTIYMYRRRIKHVVQGVEMYRFPSICHPFHAAYKIHSFP